MARQKTSPFEDIIIISSKFPWWAGVTLAVVSYLVLHFYASRPAAKITDLTQVGAVAVTTVSAQLAGYGKYILPIPFLIGAVISAVKSVKAKKLYITVANIQGKGTLLQISWSDFERLLGEYYRRKGFTVSRQGGNGPDGGVDLLLRKSGDVYLVQCKHWKAYKVGVQQVREFYGVMASRGVAGGYFVTSGVYTKEASRFAAGLNLELVGGQKLQEMIAIAQQPALRPISVDPVPPAASTTNARTAVAHSQTAPTISAPPSCPNCNAQMSRRVARQGGNAGKEFWGCTMFPKCKGTRAIEEAAVSNSDVSAFAPTMATPSVEKRSCPNCGTELVIRKFMSGPREGQQFLACLPCKKGWSGAAE